MLTEVQRIKEAREAKRIKKKLEALKKLQAKEVKKEPEQEKHKSAGRIIYIGKPEDPHKRAQSPSVERSSQFLLQRDSALSNPHISLSSLRPTSSDLREDWDISPTGLTDLPDCQGVDVLRLVLDNKQATEK